MEGFLFRQWGTDTKVDRSAVPGLNVRHLQYIATRPGAVFNPGCGFGLWGSLSEFAPAENINDLEQAKKLLRTEAERGRTIYRGLISLGEPDAAERGYYDRSKWEALVNANAAKIAKGLHIGQLPLDGLHALQQGTSPCTSHVLGRRDGAPAGIYAGRSF